MDREKSNSTLLDEIFDRLIQFGNEIDRPVFCQRLKIIWNEQRILCQSYPTITNQNLDLYKLHFLVQEQNGYLEITANRGWKEISTILGFGDSGSAAYSVKRNYVRLGLLEYECRFDRVGLDPRSVIELAEMPHAVKKRKRIHPTTSINSRSSNRTTKHLKSTVLDEVSKENSDEKSKLIVSNVHIDSNESTNRILPEQIVMSPDLDQLAFLIRAAGPAESNRSIDAVLVYLSDSRTAANFNLSSSPIFLNVILEQYLACLFELFGSNFLNNSNDNDPYLDLFLRFPLRTRPAAVGPTSNENRLKEFFFGYRTSSTRLSTKEKIVNDDGSNDDNYNVNDNKERHQKIISRCLCFATILRNLSFIDENLYLANDRRILDIFQRILVLEHDHFHEIYRDRISDTDDFLYLFTRPPNETRENDTECWQSECQSQLWIDLLDNTLITLTNLATTIDLNQCGSAQIRFRLIKTFIHWICCSLSIGNEPLISMQNENFFSSNETIFVSIKHLSLQILAKLATNPNNVDCILFEQSNDVVHQLADALLFTLCQSSNEIITEYCLSIIVSLCQRSDDLLDYLATKKISIEFLLNYLELYEHYQQQYLIATLTSCYYVNVNAPFSLPINHSIDMRIESCVHLLFRFASMKNNKILRSFESRLVEMSSSIYFDQTILKKLSEILFLLSH